MQTLDEVNVAAPEERERNPSPATMNLDHVALSDNGPDTSGASSSAFEVVSLEYFQD